jgi:hypothetical protein
MDRDTLVLVLIVAALVYFNRKPIATVTTESSAVLPDGSTVQLDPLRTVDRTALRNAVDLLMWQ